MSVMSNSLLLYPSREAPRTAQFLERLVALGWVVESPGADPVSAHDIADKLPAALLLEPGLDAAAWTAAIRALPAPANGIPVLALGSSSDTPPWPNAMLDPGSDDETILAALRQWVGPLADHDLRRPPFSPLFRLIRLMGLEQARTLHGRFIDTLAEAVAEGEAARPRAHGLAGSAGMMGHADLSAAWRLDGEDALPRALAMSAARLGPLRDLQARLSA